MEKFPKFKWKIISIRKKGTRIYFTICYFINQWIYFPLIPITVVKFIKLCWNIFCSIYLIWTDNNMTIRPLSSVWQPVIWWVHVSHRSSFIIINFISNKPFPCTYIIWMWKKINIWCTTRILSWRWAVIYMAPFLQALCYDSFTVE